MARFPSLTDLSLFPATRRSRRRGVYCTKPNILPSNVRIKSSRRKPEILILHHVCDKWIRVDHQIRRRAPPSQPSPCVADWVVPLSPMGYISVSNQVLGALLRRSGGATRDYYGRVIFEGFVQLAACMASQRVPPCERRGPLLLSCVEETMNIHSAFRFNGGVGAGSRGDGRASR